MNSHGKVSSLVGRKRRVSNGTQVLAHAVASPWQLTLSLTDQEINSPIAIFLARHVKYGQIIQAYVMNESIHRNIKIVSVIHH